MIKVETNGLIINSFDDYFKLILKKYPMWKKESKDEFVSVFGEPKKYPCLMMWIKSNSPYGSSDVHVVYPSKTIGSYFDHSEP